jgi:hypothetical protein
MIVSILRNSFYIQGLIIKKERKMIFDLSLKLNIIHMDVIKKNIIHMDLA